MSLPGCLIPIGGAEDKHGPRLVLEHFVRLAGGNQARLGVIPAASSIPDCVGQSEVIGSGSVTLVDGSRLEHTNIHSVKGHNPIVVLGVQVHILTSGYRYDLANRQARPPG